MPDTMIRQLFYGIAFLQEVYSKIERKGFRILFPFRNLRQISKNCRFQTPQFRQTAQSSNSRIPRIRRFFQII
jgi:hypothetical protein